MESALTLIEARALFDAPEHVIHLRVVGLDNRHYLDLGDITWKAVEIDESGWRIVQAPQVRFRRPAWIGALPVPVSSGSIELPAPVSQCHGHRLHFVDRLAVGRLAQSRALPGARADGRAGIFEIHDLPDPP